MMTLWGSQPLAMTDENSPAREMDPLDETGGGF